MKIKNSKLKILVATGIFSPDIGGPASYAKTLADKLKDFEVTILTYSSVFRFEDDKNQSYKIVRVWGRLPKGFRHLIYLFKALFLARKSDFIFSLNAISVGVPSLIAAKIFKKKFFVKVVGDSAWERAATKNKTRLLIDDFQKSKKSGAIGFLNKTQRWVCKKSDGIIVPSKYLADIVNGWGISREKIRVIYNGVNFKPSDLGKEEARRKLGIFGHIILSVGRLVPWKGFKMLIKIMPQILKINQVFRLIIIGDGPDRTTLETMIKNLGLEKKVFLIDKKNQSELGDYLATADMFVLNTGYEGFSHQILEAMVSGVPIITTAVGGNREIIEQGKNGFMVKYNDEFNLIEAIKSLWQDSGLKEEFIENGKKTVQKFSLEKMLSETVNFLID